ncbi:hypothetical protein FK535_07920 [Mycolicibacterium sp. 018/SC-01/001]|uniref:hypothetical protein n=1 Tax=Mycolicibacterium sp. 018/SC-01/001 TaxID=2592069 RepID=UPI00117F8577|nr:hypothetical protein [Mycolicibacterium sp. 018/SC-01/001]TRW86373.1 hypothetical protein FK535_07920 [Mycolicibacterium sp. 018/SC-01/001]
MIRTARPARLRSRRRLLLWSALPSALALAVAGALIIVVMTGRSAQQNFASGATGALADDVAVLQTLGVIEPATTHVTAGTLAVREDRLADADAEFSTALADSAGEGSCPVRVNLELVRERQGDVAAWEARLDDARERYAAALAVIDDAPPGCFAGDDDPDADRRAVRADAAARIAAKLQNLGTVAPNAPPPPPPSAAAAPAPPVGGAPVPESPQTRRLDPGRGDPLDALQRILTDAARG